MAPLPTDAGPPIEASKTVVTQRFHVWSDGTVLYAEGSSEGLALPGCARLPLLDRICIYRLHPESFRMLSRMLGRVDDADTRQPAGGELQVVIEWSGFGVRKSLLVQRRAGRTATKVLRTTNAFLPRGSSIELPGLGGVPEKPRIEETSVLRFAEGPERVAEGFRLLFAHLDAIGEVVGVEDLEAGMAVAIAAERYDLLRAWLTRLERTIRADGPFSEVSDQPLVDCVRAVLESAGEGRSSVR